MTMTAKEVREWLDTLHADALVGIDDGGLTLREVGTLAYCEVGGLPLGEPDDDCGEGYNTLSESQERDARGEDGDE